LPRQVSVAKSAVISFFKLREISYQIPELYEIMPVTKSAIKAIALVHDQICINQCNGYLRIEFLKGF
jgi:hypothetical protein